MSDDRPTSPAPSGDPTSPDETEPVAASEPSVPEAGAPVPPTPEGSAGEEPASEQDDDEEATDKPLLSRRTLLWGGVAAVGLIAVGGGIAKIISSRQTPELLSQGQVLRLTQGGGICEAPLYAAHYNGIFKDYGLRTELIKSAAGEDTKDGVSSGKYAAGPGIFFSWLKPIESGLDVKLTVGLHEGCLRLVIPNDSPYEDVSQLRGKKIGVSAVGSSAMSFFSLDLLDAGINPDPEAGEVSWVVIDNDSLPQALKDGTVDAIAASDPTPLLPAIEGWAKELANNQQGANRQLYCCAAAVNGKLIREQPEVATALVEAWAEGSRWVGANIRETAELEVDRNLVAAPVDTIEAVLKTYAFNPSATGLRKEIEPGIVKFAGTGFLDKNTDPKKLADLVYADLGFTW